MDDIEDLVLSEDYWEYNRRLERSTVTARVRRRNKTSNVQLARQLNGDVSDGDCEGTGCCSEQDCCQRNGDATESSLSNGLASSSCDSTNSCDNGNIISTSSCSNNKQSCNQKSKNVVESNNGSINATDGRTSTNIPGLARVYVRTWGCAHNSSDSEYMAGQLAEYGYDVIDSKEDAEVWLLNSCTVKSPAEAHLRNEIRAAHALGKKVVVAGCVSQGAPRSEFLAGLSIVGVQQIDRIVEVVEETLRGNSVRLLGTKKLSGKKQGGASLLLPKIRRNPLIEIISINTGCLNQCTYCKTKHARGHLGSYSIEEIVERAEQSFREGVVEIWLTSEDTGAYGRDIGVTLPDLLRELVKVIPEGCKLRLGMTNPPYILDHLEEMAVILQHPRVYRFLHVPVQSGSDNVLLDMKREYTRKQFSCVVDTLRDRVSGLTIATDIICGYPTETDEDFQETMSLCREYRFPSLFINQFFPRPGTPAARLPRIDPKQVKLRTKALSDLFQSYRPYEHKLGQEQSVLVTEESHDMQHWVAHNACYDQVLVPKVDGYLGKTLRVRITETGKHFLRGCVLEDARLQSPALRPTLQKGAVSGVTAEPVVTKDTPGEQQQQQQKQPRPSNTYVVVSIVFLVVTLLVKFFYQRYGVVSTYRGDVL